MKLQVRLLVSLLIMCCAFVGEAQRIQVVDNDGQPVAYVCVTNAAGVLIGNTDNDGWLEDAKGTTTLFFSHVAFKPRNVALADITDGKVVLEDVEFDLPEVTVKPKELVYVQTYYRLIYFDEDGPIYFRGGVIDNTYEIANKKVSSKTRSLARGRSGFLRFLISTIVGRYIDKWGQIPEKSTYQRIQNYEKNGYLTLAVEPSGRTLVSDSICELGYILTDTAARQRTTSFDIWKYRDHRDQAEAKAKGKDKKKDNKKEEDSDEDEESFYEVYRIDEQGRSRIDDFVMHQLFVKGTHRRQKTNYVLLLQAYTTDRDYIDKSEYKQLRKENKVEMEINELRQFEKGHNIPPLAKNIQDQIDKLFEKDLKK